MQEIPSLETDLPTRLDAYFHQISHSVNSVSHLNEARRTSNCQSEVMMPKVDACLLWPWPHEARVATVATTKDESKIKFTDSDNKRITLRSMNEPCQPCQPCQDLSTWPHVFRCISWTFREAFSTDYLFRQRPSTLPVESATPQIMTRHRWGVEVQWSWICLTSAIASSLTHLRGSDIHVIRMCSGYG